MLAQWSKSIGLREAGSWFNTSIRHERLRVDFLVFWGPVSHVKGSKGPFLFVSFRPCGGKCSPAVRAPVPAFVVSNLGWTLVQTPQSLSKPSQGQKKIEWWAKVTNHRMSRRRMCMSFLSSLVLRLLFCVLVYYHCI